MRIEARSGKPRGLERLLDRRIVDIDRRAPQCNSRRQQAAASENPAHLRLEVVAYRRQEQRLSRHIEIPAVGGLRIPPAEDPGHLHHHLAVARQEVEPFDSGGSAFAQAPIDEQGDQRRAYIGAHLPDDTLDFGEPRRSRQAGLAAEAEPEGRLQLPGLRSDLLVAVRNRLLERRRPQSRGPGPLDVAVVIVAKMLDLIGRQSEHATDLGVELARGFHLSVAARADEQIAALQNTQRFEHPLDEILRQIGIRDEDRASEPGTACCQQRESGRHGNDGIGLDGHFDGCQMLGGDAAPGSFPGGERPRPRWPPE